ncbi:MAG TPA: Calx-beta domain-containing protein [Povalibacter sp.]|uniref:Calx-beta domain-containing protein n=1 Tax=Povalibacter sp. TaxID=1962978 RepID=UPI002C8928A4|nr:Calx-beta domain-containing protein [Povalibacter sp.]HMN46684.1 Calx-beta domain-containing protein [Povalibacter sp.]
MKHTTIQTLGALTLCALLAGCGSDGETTESTGVDTSVGTGGGGGGTLRNAGRLQFSIPSLTVAENAGNATLTITRTDGTDGAVSVTVATSNGTAAQPQDYTAVNTTVTFAAGDATAKTVNIPIANDTEVETGETLTVTLSSATGGASLGSTAQVLITIADDDVAAPTAARAVVSAAARALRLDWTTATGATSYRVMKDAAGTGAFVQVGTDLGATAKSTDVAVTLLDENWATATYAIDACNAGGCTRSNVMPIAGLSTSLITYVKASNSSDYSYFGREVALSADGNTLAIGAPGDNSAATGIGGNEVDDCNDDATNCAYSSGAVYVYTRTGSSWSAATYIKASNAASGNQFGSSISLSADGNTLAVGAEGHDSWRGAAYLFTRNGGTWQEAALIQAADGVTNDSFGISLSLNPEGSMLAVGASWHAVGATSYAGAVYVYSRNGASWDQATKLTHPNPVQSAEFGEHLALAGTAGAPVLALGSPYDSLDAGSPPVTLQSAGSVFVFRPSGSTWTSTRIVNPSPNAWAYFGMEVTLSADGSTLALLDGGNLTPANPADPTLYSPGIVHVYASDGTSWTSQAQIIAPNATDYMAFGRSLALNSDGTLLAVGAPSEDGSASGLDGVPDDALQNSGAVFVFDRSGTEWSAKRYVKAPSARFNHYFGAPIALSDDGKTLAIGSPQDSTDADNINGDPFDDCASAATNCAYNSGAVYVY